MDKMDNLILKWRKPMGVKSLMQLDKKGKLVCAFNVNFIRRLLKETKGKRIGKYIYFCKNNKDDAFVLGVLLKKKKGLFLAHVYTYEHNLIDEYNAQLKN